MFGVHLRFLRERVKRKKDNDSNELSLENANLTPGQIATAQKALRILGLESRLDELKKEDCVVFLYAMGLNPTDDIIDSKLRAFKLHHKKLFTFGQLAHVWHSMLQDLADEDEILKRAFQFFDKDGNGEISVQELRTTMHELGDLLTEEEITSFMRIMDVNNDGAIGYNEFLATLKTQAPNLASGGSVGALDPRGELQQQQQLLQLHATAATAASLSLATSVPNGVYEPPQAPFYMPSAAADQTPTVVGAAKPTAPPLAGPALAPGPPGDGGSDGGGGCAAGLPSNNSGAAGGDQVGGDPPERTRGSLIVRAGSASSFTQLPAFPARRQPSLKAGLAPPAAAAEPLLATDAAAAAPPLPRPSSSRRLGQSPSASRMAWGLGCGQAPAPALERAGSQRRADDAPPPGPGVGGLGGSRPGSCSGGDGADPGQGLRAPSTLEAGSGSEGTTTT